MPIDRVKKIPAMPTSPSVGCRVPPLEWPAGMGSVTDPTEETQCAPGRSRSSSVRFALHIHPVHELVHRHVGDDEVVGLGEVVRGTEITREAIERVIADVVEPVRVHMLIAGARYTSKP